MENDVSRDARSDLVARRSLCASTIQHARGTNEFPATRSRGEGGLTGLRLLPLPLKMGAWLVLRGALASPPCCASLRNILKSFYNNIYLIELAGPPQWCRYSLTYNKNGRLKFTSDPHCCGDHFKAAVGPPLESAKMRAIFIKLP